MNYSLEKIGTVATCDTLLVQAHKKKRSLERKRRNLGEAIDAFRKKMDEIGPDLALTQLLLDTLTTASVAMPEGKDKLKTVIKVKQLEARQAVQEAKSRRYHVHVLLAKEMAYMLLDSQVSVMERYIDALQTVMATLSPPVLTLIQASAIVPTEADMAAKTAAVTPEVAAWQTVVGAYLNTTAVPSGMASLRMVDPVDDPLINTPVRRTGRASSPPTMVRSDHAIPLLQGTVDTVGDELRYSA